MKITNPCDGSKEKTTNPISGGYFKTSVCTYCKDVRGVTWDSQIKRFRFAIH